MKGWALIVALMAFAFGADVYEFNGTYSRAASQIVAQMATHFR
jgi:hypothetical protein